MKRLCEIICALLLLKRVDFCEISLRFQQFCTFFSFNFRDSDSE